MMGMTKIIWVCMAPAMSVMVSAALSSFLEWVWAANWCSALVEVAGMSMTPKIN